MSFRVIIFIIIVLGFIALGLSERGVDFSFDFSNPGTFSTSQPGSAPRDLNDDGTIDDREREIADIEDEIEDIEKDITEFAQSPYADVVTLRQHTARDRDAQDEYIDIEIDRDLSEPLSLTGWKLTGQENNISVTLGRVAFIPDYDRTQQEIRVEAGQTVHILTRRSPIRDSFRTNVCTGYLSEDRTFKPSLRRECPNLLTEDILSPLGIDLEDVEDDIHDGRSNTDTRCYRAIDRLSTCREPNTIPDDISRRCEDFLDDIGYEWCVETYNAQTNFFTDEWYVYLRSSFEDLWGNDDDTITLFDQNGRIVDSISY